MDTKHTPGPWSLNTITEHNGQLRDGWYGVWGNQREVARIHVDDPSSTNARDDARLIAAAPALYAALVEVEKYARQQSEAGVDPKTDAHCWMAVGHIVSDALASVEA